MNRIFIAAGLFAAFFTFGHMAANDAEEATAVAPVAQQVDAEADADVPLGCDFEEVAKKCSTSSDCPNSKCKSGRCGGCSTSSDCKYGKCKSGQCGGCSTSSDCGGWGKCKSGRCGGCSTSSDCGGFGSCSGGKCGKTPY